MIIMILAQCCTADATLDSLPQLRLCKCSPDFPTPQEIQLSNTCNQLMHCEKYMCNLMFFGYYITAKFLPVRDTSKCFD